MKLGKGFRGIWNVESNHWSTKLRTTPLPTHYYFAFIFQARSIHRAEFELVKKLFRSFDNQFLWNKIYALRLHVLLQKHCKYIYIDILNRFVAKMNSLHGHRAAHTIFAYRKENKLKLDVIRIEIKRCQQYREILEKI